MFPSCFGKPDCDVCGCDFYDETLVKCSTCLLPAHKSCLLERNIQCNSCTSQNLCEICNNSKGFILQTSRMSFTHPFCELISLHQRDHFIFMESKEKIMTVGESQQFRCIVCKNTSAHIKCSQSNCQQYIHPYCLVNSNYRDGLQFPNQLFKFGRNQLFMEIQQQTVFKALYHLQMLEVSTYDERLKEYFIGLSKRFKIQNFNKKFAFSCKDHINNGTKWLTSSTCYDLREDAEYLNKFLDQVYKKEKIPSLFMIFYLFNFTLKNLSNQQNIQMKHLIFLQSLGVADQIISRLRTPYLYDLRLKIFKLDQNAKGYIELVKNQDKSYFGLINALKFVEIFLKDTNLEQYLLLVGKLQFIKESVNLPISQVYEWLWIATKLPHQMMEYYNLKFHDLTKLPQQPLRLRLAGNQVSTLEVQQLTHFLQPQLMDFFIEFIRTGLIIPDEIEILSSDSLNQKKFKTNLKTKPIILYPFCFDGHWMLVVIINKNSVLSVEENQSIIVFNTSKLFNQGDYDKKLLELSEVIIGFNKKKTQVFEMETHQKVDLKDNGVFTIDNIINFIQDPNYYLDQHLKNTTHQIWQNPPSGHQFVINGLIVELFFSLNELIVVPFEHLNIFSNRCTFLFLQKRQLFMERHKSTLWKNEQEIINSRIYNYVENLISNYDHVFRSNQTKEIFYSEKSIISLSLQSVQFSQQNQMIQIPLKELKVYLDNFEKLTGPNSNLSQNQSATVTQGNLQPSSEKQRIYAMNLQKIIYDDGIPITLERECFYFNILLDLGDGFIFTKMSRNIKQDLMLNQYKKYMIIIGPAKPDDIPSSIFDAYDKFWMEKKEYKHQQNIYYMRRKGYYYD